MKTQTPQPDQAHTTDPLAYSDGWEAAAEPGARLTANPYPKNTPASREWRSGFLDSRRHYE